MNTQTILGILWCALLLGGVAACSEDPAVQPRKALFVRVENLSDHVLQNVTLTFPDNNVEVWDVIEQEGESRYREVNLAYEVVHISLQVAGEWYSDTPSYDGYSPLPKANYTYRVNVDTHNKTLSVEFVQTGG